MSSIIEQLEKLFALKNAGAINEQQYEQFKEKLLEPSVPSVPSVPSLPSVPSVPTPSPKPPSIADSVDYQSCDDYESDTGSIASEIPDSKHYLNYAPCQFPASKTQALIQKMKINIEESPHRQMHLIYINNNTAEAEQLKGRLDNHFNKRLIFNICSRSVLKIPYEKLKTRLRTSKTQDSFPLAIIACPTDKGKKEFNKIIQIINNLEFTVMTHLVIDEADKNLEVIKYALSINHTFSSNHYITATPTPKLIKEIGVGSLEHLNTQLPGNNFNDAFEKYHKIEDNNIHFIDGELDLVSFAKAVLDKISIDIIFTDNLRVFCPGEINRASHTQLCKLFKAEFNILVFNTEKYFLVNEQRIDYYKFAKTVKNNSEISNVLGAFTKQYPGHFVIIGNSCVSRGMTFNSENFHFTDAIYHPGIAQQKEKTEQIMSRSCGHKDFCKPHNIYVTKEAYEDIILQVQGKTRLLKLNPTSFEANDFRKIKAKDMDIDYIILQNWTSVKKYGDFVNKKYPNIFSGFDSRNRLAKTTKNGKPDLNNTPLAPDHMKEHGENPSIYHVLKYQPSLSQQNPRSTVRAVPLNDYRWLIIWRPSFFPEPLPKVKDK